MIKPDGVQRGLVAPILDRFLSKVRSCMGGDLFWGGE